LALRQVDVRDVVSEVSDVVQQLAEERSLRFLVQVASDPLILRTDPDKLKQILLNLVANAVKYSERGEVRVAAAHDDRGAVTIQVSDTGVGIAPQNLRRIFEPFWQADRAPRTRHTGTGLGLSVVQRLVRVLGGKIDVTSTLGRGSTFTLVFPREGESQ
jgi:signal transduction histidine kinase